MDVAQQRSNRWFDPDLVKAAQSFGEAAIPRFIAAGESLRNYAQGRSTWP